MTGRPTVIARVRWRGGWWAESSSTRVRLFTRPANANDYAERLRAKGYAVEVCYAELAPWAVAEGAPFSVDAPDGAEGDLW